MCSQVVPPMFGDSQVGHQQSVTPLGAEVIRSFRSQYSSHPELKKSLLT